MGKIVAGPAYKVVLAGTYDDGSGDYIAPSVAVASLPGVATLVSDATATDSDKTLTTPDGYQDHVLSVFVTLTTDATVGDRQMVVEVRNLANVIIGQARAGIVQAASLTRYYQFSPTVQDMLAFRDTDYLTVPMPMWVLPPGFQLRVWDNNAIAAAGDTMVVQVLVLREPV